MYLLTIVPAQLPEIIPLSVEPVERHQLTTPAPELFEVHTPATSQQQAAIAAEKLRLRLEHQEVLIEQAAYQLRQERDIVGNHKEALLPCR